MKTKLCLPIIEKNAKQVLATVKQLHDTYDLIEVHIDTLEDSPAVVENLVKELTHQLGDKLIILSRNKNMQHLLPILSVTKSFVDIDIDKQQEVLTHIKNNNGVNRVICSFHDYKKTPRTNALMQIIKKMETFHPEIYKISTFCESPKDAVHLMHLLLDLQKQHKKVIVVGMGDHGKITRIFGAQSGNAITYTPEDREKASAPGQIIRAELQKILAIMKGNYAR